MKPQHWIATDVGVVREHNEDAFLWLSPEETGGHGYLWVIADGMGGEAAGELASRCVVEAVREVYPIAIEKLGDPYAAIEASFSAANRRILRMQKKHPEHHKMGTTAVALAYYNDRVYISHVGDSRCYAWFAGELRQLTKDHTKLQMFLDAGAIREEEAENHPSRHVLVNAIGREAMSVDHNGRTPIRIDNKVFLLCSDGLTGYVPELQIASALRRMYARDATESLIELARHHWSEDNTSVAVIRFCEPDPDTLTDKTSFLKWARAQSIGRTKRDPTVKIRADVLPLNDEIPPVASVSSILRFHSDGDDEHPSADERGSTGKIAGPRPSFRASDTEPRLGAVTRNDEGSDDATREDAAEDGRDRKDGRGSETVGRITARTESGNHPTAGVDRRPAGSARPQRSGSSTRGLPSGEFERFDPAPRASRDLPRPAQGQDHDRIHALGLGTEDLALIREYRDVEEMSETDHLNMIGKGPAQRRRVMVILGVLFVAFLALVLVFVLRRGSNDDDSPMAQTDTEFDDSAEPATPDAGQTGLRATEGSDIGRDVTAPLRPEESVSVARWVAPDNMPLIRIPSADGPALYVDAHEVTVGQFRHILQQDRTLQTLHREIDAPRYAEMPCSTGVSTDRASFDEPVCVSPESAERYCTLVGRSLPTRTDWRYAFEHGRSRISAGNGRLHFFARDGAAGDVPPPQSIEGIYGVFDGYPEILQSSELDSARGDIPLLGIDSRAREQFAIGNTIRELTPPISVQSSLRTNLQSNSLSLEARPQLGFRCVVNERQFEKLRAFSTPDGEQPTDSTGERETSGDPPRTAETSPRRAGARTSSPQNSSSSRIHEIEPFPDRAELEARRAASRRQYPSPRNEGDADARSEIVDDPNSRADELRTDGLLERIDRRLNEQ